MTAERGSLGLYLHIPFCRSKCRYCDFYSLPRAEGEMDRYVRALTAQLIRQAPLTAGYGVDTIYFGGGTPSYLGWRRLTSLLETALDHSRVCPDSEITLEANPDSLEDPGQVRELVSAGFNRVSLGVQSADDGELRAMGRVHTFAQARSAVRAARTGGIENLSLDLIYGLPDQTMDRWRRTVERVLELEPEHLSCYGLKLEEGTPLWRQREELTLPDGDRQADMVLWTVDRLAAAGYEQYEISNFARPGFASRHNEKYWDLSHPALSGLRPRGPLRLRRRPGRLGQVPGRLLPGDRGRRGAAPLRKGGHLPPGAGRGVCDAGPAHRPGAGPPRL